MLGHDRAIPEDFRTASTAEAARCRLFFDASRRSVLSAHAWIFATLPATLACDGCHADLCRAGWHAFPLPADCLNVIRAWDPCEDPVDFAPSGHGVECPCDRPTIQYVRDATDLGEWPQPVLDALAAELAARLAGPMTGSADKAAAFRRDAARQLAAAAEWNARQAPQRRPTNDRYINARNGHDCHGYRR